MVESITSKSSLFFVMFALFGLNFYATGQATNFTEDREPFSFKGQPLQSSGDFLHIYYEMDDKTVLSYSLWKTNELLSEVVIKRKHAPNYSAVYQDVHASMTEPYLKESVVALYELALHISPTNLSDFVKLSPDVYDVSEKDPTTYPYPIHITITPVYSTYVPKEASAVRIYIKDDPAFLSTLDNCICSQMLDFAEILKLSDIQKMSAKYLLLFPSQFLKNGVSKAQVNYLHSFANQLKSIEKNTNSLNTLICSHAEDNELPVEVRSIIENYFLYFMANKSF